MELQRQTNSNQSRRPSLGAVYAERTTMIDQNNILTRDQHRLELAMLMAEYEKKAGPVRTLPIRIGDDPDPAWRIHCPDKPKAGSKRAAAPREKKPTRTEIKMQKVAVIKRLLATGMKLADVADQADFTPKLTVNYVMKIMYAHGLKRGPDA